MDRNTLLKHSAILISIIFFLNFLAGKFYWYYTIWFFDMLMHFLGGLWLALLFFVIFPKALPTLSTIIKILVWVLVVGILWEIFEIIFVNYVAQNSFNTTDTLSDICCDLAGGLTGILYVYKKIGDMKRTTV